jgi:hypothetical protein
MKELITKAAKVYYIDNVKEHKDFIFSERCLDDEIIDAFKAGAKYRQSEIDTLVEVLKDVQSAMGKHSIMDGYYDKLDKFLIEEGYD